MRKKRVTLDYLKRKVWWWRRQQIRRNGIVGVAWDKNTKEAARNYELMRRAPGAKEFKKSYLELNGNEQTFVHVLWCNWPKQVYRFATDKGQFNEKGWTPVFANPPVQWNLKLADCILIAEFKRQITLARAIQRIRPPHALKGKKHRSGSWKYIEILDRQKNDLGPFSQGESHMASEGKRKGRRFLRNFNITLKKAVQQMRQDHCTIAPKSAREPFELVASGDSLTGDTGFVRTCAFFNFQIIDAWQ